MPFTLDNPVLGLLWYFEATGIMLVAVTLVVRCYEGVYRNFLAENEHLIQAQEDREALQSNFQQAQKLESPGVMASGIAHDFNNLRTSIRCRSIQAYQSPISDSSGDIYKWICTGSGG